MTEIAMPPRLEPDSVRLAARPPAFAPTLVGQRQLQTFVETMPDGTRVLYGTDGTPIRQWNVDGSIVSFDLKGGAEAGGRFAGALKLFALTASLGSTESLVVAPQMMRGRDLTQDQLRISAVTEGTVRLSIGLEDVDDLMEDVTQALSAAAGAG